MMENWKEVAGYNGVYDISDTGNVRRRGSDRFSGAMVPRKNKNGYLVVKLRSGRCQKSFLVHRLVLSAFVGPCPDGFNCDHIDGNKENNSVSNLRWVTPKQNCDYAISRTGGWGGEGHGAAKLTWPQVRLVRSVENMSEPTARLLASAWGVKHGTVMDLRHRGWVCLRSG